jgi:hypothetical protein
VLIAYQLSAIEIAQSEIATLASNIYINSNLNLDIETSRQLRKMIGILFLLLPPGLPIIDYLAAAALIIFFFCYYQ